MDRLKNRTRMNISLSKEMATQLRTYCKETGQEMSGLIERLLSQYFENPSRRVYEVCIDGELVSIKEKTTSKDATR